MKKAEILKQTTCSSKGKIFNGFITKFKAELLNSRLYNFFSNTYWLQDGKVKKKANGCLFFQPTLYEHFLILASISPITDLVHCYSQKRKRKRKKKAHWCNSAILIYCIPIVLLLSRKGNRKKFDCWIIYGFKSKRGIMRFQFKCKKEYLTF